MKKSMKVLLIVSIVVTLFGAIGLIAVSNREIDRSHERNCESYKDMWSVVLWAAEGTWPVSESDRKQWPEIDQLVLEAKADPETMERIRNDYLPDAKKNWRQAYEIVDREEEGKRIGIERGCIITTAGVILFGIWLLLFLKAKKAARKENTAEIKAAGKLTEKTATGPEETMPDPKETESPDAFERLKKLGELYGAGILTEEEYLSKKAELLTAL